MEENGAFLPHFFRGEALKFEISKGRRSALALYDLQNQAP
jgi:hypothetical protein